MEITNITNTDSTEFINQDYTSQDGELLNSLVVNQEFGLPEDRVEVHILSSNGDLLNSVYDFRNYTTKSTIEGSSLYNNIELDPKSDLESFGYFTGQYDVLYNFYRNLFQSSDANKFFISEISSDRTEIKISNNNLSYTELGQSYLNFITTRNSRAFYSDFLLNASNNETYIGVNVALDNVNTTLPSLFVKLYEPLPSNFRLKDTFWIAENISEPYSFNVNTEFIAEAISDSTPLRGPNVNVELAEKTNLTTSYLNLSNLINSSTTSSFQQLQSWMEEKSIEITVDYNDFANFVHFSSAQERLENFKYKLTQIQSLQSDIDSLGNLSALTGDGYINVSKNNIQTKINAIIEKFDGYEYFLYYESGSNSWPKSNSEKPYINQPVNSNDSKTWFGSELETSIFYGGKILEANNFDINNRDYIWNSLPEYIKSDSQNSNLELFVAMMGQHYDNIWTYAKDITDLQVADNRIDFGISKDLVADTLRNFGIKLYTNSRGQDDLYLSLLGIDSNNNTLPSTGSLVIDTFVTSSNQTIPNNDIVKETYKRIYHNLPYLLKTKGTRTGLRALINCFGIPETILKVKEYGGTKKDQNLIEQFNEKFNYSLKINSQDANPTVLNLPFGSSEKQFLDTGFNDINADTIEFRFKLSGSLSPQSLLEGNSKYVQVTQTTGKYADIEFKLLGENGWVSSPKINLPLYNNDWWVLNLSRKNTSRISNSNINNTYTLTIGNKDSNGIQFLESSSISIDSSTPQYNSNWDDTLSIGEGLYNEFSGDIQEVRYWIGSIPTDNFKDHILNPTSISYNDVTGSYNNLIFRLPLGAELDNNLNLTSVHPSTTSSFYNGGTPISSATIDNSSYVVYNPNHELFLVNTPNIGNITQVDQKVRIPNQNLVPGEVLTPYITIQKPEDYPYTNDLSIVDITLSPQDSINEDIISQLGSFNIDEYVGDPRLNSLNSYPKLDQLRDFYFQKYSKSQNVFDIIKLLSYFDNSLFKMIKDFVPAKTNLSTGLTIKSHILERNKIARHEPVLEFSQYSGSIETAFMSGSNGLNLNLNTNHTTTTKHLSSVIEKSHTDKAELFNGELGGTVVTAHTQTSESIVYELNNIDVNSSQGIQDNFSRLPLNPILNNISQARTSPNYLDIDYSSNPITPVNFNFLTSSLFQNLNTTAFPFLNAPVQDSNYTLKRHVDPRYNGSKSTSALYNTYTVGDTSYGSTAAIDTNPVKFAYFNEITSQSLTFSGRSNVNIKYLIDSASNVIELTEANNNLFDVQSVFNKTNANIALEDINKPSRQKALNGLKSIYAGGFRYEPILQNYSNELTQHSSLKFNLESAISIPNPNANIPITSEFANAIDIVGIDLSNSTSYGYNGDNRTTAIEGGITSGINVRLKRKLQSSSTIYQKITGSIEIDFFISPLTTGMATLFDRNHTNAGLTTTVSLPYPKTDLLGKPWGSSNNGRMDDNLRYATIPPGFTLRTWNNRNNIDDSSITATLIGSNSTKVQIPNWDNPSNGIDVIEIVANGSSHRISLSISSNDFGTEPTFKINDVPYNINAPQNFDLTNTNFKITTIIPIEGIIELLPGQSNAFEEISIPLKTLNYQLGQFTSFFYVSKNGAASSPAFFDNNPIIRKSAKSQESSYLFLAAPLTIYSSEIIDNGYNPGSIQEDNWYFELGKNSANIDTQITASFDLSKLYHDYIEPASVNNTNLFIQNSPTGTLYDGYQIVTEPFKVKAGDLIRFYNHESETFPNQIEFEREIISVIKPLGTPIAGTYTNRLVFEVLPYDNKGILLSSCINYRDLPSTSIKGKILNVIILSKIPDETNIVVNHEKNEGQTSAGIIFSSNISENLKNEAGDIIKNLKSQNLI